MKYYVSYNYITLENLEYLYEKYGYSYVCDGDKKLIGEYKNE